MYICIYYVRSCSLWLIHLYLHSRPAPGMYTYLYTYCTSCLRLRVVIVKMASKTLSHVDVCMNAIVKTENSFVTFFISLQGFIREFSRVTENLEIRKLSSDKWMDWAPHIIALAKKDNSASLTHILEAYSREDETMVSNHSHMIFFSFHWMTL